MVFVVLAVLAVPAELAKRAEALHVTEGQAYGLPRLFAAARIRELLMTARCTDASPGFWLAYVGAQSTTAVASTASARARPTTPATSSTAVEECPAPAHVSPSSPALLERTPSGRASLRREVPFFEVRGAVLFCVREAVLPGREAPRRTPAAVRGRGTRDARSRAVPRAEGEGLPADPAEWRDRRRSLASDVGAGCTTSPCTGSSPLSGVSNPRSFLRSRPVRSARRQRRIDSGSRPSLQAWWRRRAKR